jgi:L-asparaginase / beta-aspartyl-peptidase
MSKLAIAVHGGAGGDPVTGMTPAKREAHHKALREATLAGYRMLESGAPALDAVEASMRALEDCPLFNAGRGAAFTRSGIHEMDAAIMCGRTLRAGAVAAVRNIKNPIALARVVMDECPHLFMVSKGAEDLARAAGLEFMPHEYFYSEHKYVQWQRENELRAAGEERMAKEAGTAGAVALDRDGNLAAATSTGGLSNKLEYRVGDTPVIGAGTYARNDSCAVSCSGDGEYMIRLAAAHEVSALVRHLKMGIEEACSRVLDELRSFKGDAGIVALDKDGRLTFAFNTKRFYRGWKTSDGDFGTAIYKDS